MVFGLGVRAEHGRETGGMYPAETSKRQTGDNQSICKSATFEYLVGGQSFVGCLPEDTNCPEVEAFILYCFQQRGNATLSTDRKITYDWSATNGLKMGGMALASLNTP